jgi:hypothetical protein
MFNTNKFMRKNKKWQAILALILTTTLVGFSVLALPAQASRTGSFTHVEIRFPATAEIKVNIGSSTDIDLIVPATIEAADLSITLAAPFKINNSFTSYSTLSGTDLQFGTYNSLIDTQYEFGVGDQTNRVQRAKQGTITPNLNPNTFSISGKIKLVLSADEKELFAAKKDILHLESDSKGEYYISFTNYIPTFNYCVWDGSTVTDLPANTLAANGFQYIGAGGYDFIVFYSQINNIFIDNPGDPPIVIEKPPEKATPTDIPKEPEATPTDLPDEPNTPYIPNIPVVPPENPLIPNIPDIPVIPEIPPVPEIEPEIPQTSIPEEPISRQPYIPGQPPIPSRPGNTVVEFDEITYIELDENDTPLGSWNLDEDGEEWIWDDEVPKASFPETADPISALLQTSLVMFGILSISIITEASIQKKTNKHKR